MSLGADPDATDAMRTARTTVTVIAPLLTAEQRRRLCEALDRTHAERIITIDNAVRFGLISRAAGDAYLIEWAALRRAARPESGP